jgi:hypothetical protein
VGSRGVTSAAVPTVDQVCPWVLVEAVRGWLPVLTLIVGLDRPVRRVRVVRCGRG